MSSLNFKEGEYVVWDPGVSGVPIGSGIIRGVTTAADAVIGMGYIVELEPVLRRAFKLPYSCVSILEMFLKPEFPTERF
jgi:hypothetical protein